MDVGNGQVGVKVTILFYGDPHGRYQKLFDAVDQHSPDAVIVLGDFMLTKPLEQQVAPILDKTEFWFIHGNHDTDSDEYYQYLYGSNLAHRNLHGRVQEIGGMRVAGLGGVFRGNVWHPDLNNGEPAWRHPNDFMACQPSVIRRQAEKMSNGLMRKHHSSIWWSDYERLFDLQADVLVTHEAPSCHAYGFAELDLLAFSMGVKQIFHGHHHENYHSVIQQGINLVKVDGVALASVKDQQGNLL